MAGASLGPGGVCGEGAVLGWAAAFGILRRLWRGEPGFDRRETEVFMAELACTSTLHAGVAAVWRVCASRLGPATQHGHGADEVLALPLAACGS